MTILALLSWQFLLLAPVALAEAPQSLLFEKPTLQVQFPSLQFTDSENIIAKGQGKIKYFAIPWIAEYITAAYRFGVAIAGVLAVIMIIAGGFVWMTAGGNSSQVDTAKTYIIGALAGLVLALGSYTLLWLINPNLTQLPFLRVPVIQRVGLGDFCPLVVSSQQKIFTLKEDGTADKEVPIGTTIPCGKRLFLSDGADNQCMGLGDCSGSQLCLPDFSKDIVATGQGSLKFEFDCFSSAQDQCKKLNDNQADKVGLPHQQSTCNLINSTLAYQSPNTENQGRCVWVDKSIITEIITGGWSDDGCYWCPDDRYQDMLTTFKEYKINPIDDCANGLGKIYGQLTGIEALGELLSSEDKEACLARWCGGQ